MTIKQWCFVLSLVLVCGAFYGASAEEMAGSDGNAEGGVTVIHKSASTTAPRFQSDETKKLLARLNKAVKKHPCSNHFIGTEDSHYIMKNSFGNCTLQNGSSAGGGFLHLSPKGLAHCHFDVFNNKDGYTFDFEGERVTKKIPDNKIRINMDRCDLVDSSCLQYVRNQIDALNNKPGQSQCSTNEKISPLQ